MLNAALKDGTETLGNKASFWHLDFGVLIGAGQAGQETSTIEVLVDNNTGKVITGYPK